MKSHFEKINNRYRGPFEKQKTYFFLNQIISSLLSIEAENNSTSNDIKNLMQNNETSGLGISVSGNNISDKEKLRDRIIAIEGDALRMLKELDTN